MRHEITIGDVEKRSIEILRAPLDGTATITFPSAYRGEYAEITIRPDYIDATFTRTPNEPIWRCTTVEVGGPRATGKGSRSHLYEGARGMPPLLARVLDELVKELPE